MEEPIERPSGRVIAVDPEGCVLMFRVEDPADTKPAIWMTPGGGVEPGDSTAEAAVREFFAWRGPRFEPSTLGWSAREHELHAAWRWWDADDLEQSNEAVLPAVSQPSHAPSRPVPTPAPQSSSLGSSSTGTRSAARLRSERRRGGTLMRQVIKFYAASEDYGAFSSFSHHAVCVDGRVWMTAEHYFQAQKFDDRSLQAAIASAPSAKHAASLGRDRSLPIPAD